MQRSIGDRDNTIHTLVFMTILYSLYSITYILYRLHPPWAMPYFVLLFLLFAFFFEILKMNVKKGMSHAA